MEKIIAVVIMVVIVIGLIATVIIPQGAQVTTAGGQAQNQLDAVVDSMNAGTIEVNGLGAGSEWDSDVASLTTYVAYATTNATKLNITTIGIGGYLAVNGATMTYGEAANAVSYWNNTSTGNSAIAAVAGTKPTFTATTTYLVTRLDTKDTNGASIRLVLIQPK